MKTISTPQGPLPIRYGWQALSDFADETGITLNEILGKFNPGRLKPSDLSSFIFYGMMDGSREANAEFKLQTVAEVADIINGVGLTKIVREVLEAYQASPFIINSAEEEKEGKKK